MTARIANGGRAVRPWLVRGKTGQANPKTDDPAPSLEVSTWALSFVQKGMYEVVNGDRGTARSSKLNLPEVAMAGKTGTSQVRRISRAERATGVVKNEDKPWEERDHALFVAYAPWRAPRYAVAVVVEHGGSGSQAAAPIARDIRAKALELDPGRPRAVLSAGRTPGSGAGRS
jgi:penicillin-binding protein 2